MVNKCNPDWWSLVLKGHLYFALYMQPHIIYINVNRSHLMMGGLQEFLRRYLRLVISRVILDGIRSCESNWKVIFFTATISLSRCRSIALYTIPYVPTPKSPMMSNLSLTSQSSSKSSSSLAIKSSSFSRLFFAGGSPLSSEEEQAVTGMCLNVLLSWSSWSFCSRTDLGLISVDGEEDDDWIRKDPNIGGS